MSASRVDTRGVSDLNVTFNSSNWKNYRGNEFHTGFARLNGPVKSNAKFVLSLQSSVVSSPAIDKFDNIYFGTMDNHMFKVSPSGSYIWYFNTSSEIISSPALSFEEDVIYIANNNAQVFAISTSTGHLIWSATMLGSITGSPYVFGKGETALVIIASTASLLWCFNATSGKIQLIYSTVASLDYSSPVVYNNTIYIGTVYNAVINCSLVKTECDDFFDTTGQIR